MQGRTDDHASGELTSALPDELPAPAALGPAAHGFASALGNQAFGRLARQQQPPAAPAAPAAPGAPPASGPLASLVTGQMTGAPEKSKNVTASAEGDKVVARAPAQMMSGEVTVQSDKLGDDDKVQVGFIQQITSFSRIGVYKDDNDPTKDPVEDVVAGAGLRDVHPNRPGPAPFYEMPTEVAKGSAPEKLTVSAMDAPESKKAKKIGDLRLVGLKGKDSFDVTLAAKRGAEIAHLDTYHWEVPWDVTVDANGDGTGGKISDQDDTGVIPTALSGPAGNAYANDPRNRARRYPDDAAAEAELRSLGPAAFISMIGATERLDPKSYWHMVTAIWKVIPKFTVKVRVVEEDDFWTKTDKVSVNLTGSQTATRPVELVEKETTTVVIPLPEVIDPPKLSSPPEVKLTVGKAPEQALAFPWALPEKLLTAGAGGYAITVTFG